MSQRTALVLQLASIDVGFITIRRSFYTTLLSTGTPDQIAAKFRDFYARGFLTTDNWMTAELTPAGQSVRASVL